MNTIHDDYPHPVPPMAYLRWKENWGWAFLDPENKVMVVAHFNYEPLFDRGRITFLANVEGKIYQYGNEIPFPEDFAYSTEIGDDKVKALFKEPESRFEVHAMTDDLTVDLELWKRAPLFDYIACHRANPDRPSLLKMFELDTNSRCRHAFQALNMKGTLKTASGTTLTLSGVGGRDHSLGMRCDHLLGRHDFTIHLFEEHTFTAINWIALDNPHLQSLDGYVHDKSGARAMREVKIHHIGEGPEGMPESVRFEMKDVFGKPYTITADVANRLSYVPILSEAPHGKHVYRITENFCKCTLEETGETGYSFVEIGRHSSTE